MGIHGVGGAAVSELAEALESLADLLEESISLREDQDSGWVTIHGRAVFIGGNESKLSERQQRALKSYKPAKKDVQDIANKSEEKLSKALGVPRTADNSAFDLRNDDIGIEVKTMVTGTNDKITMSSAALGRKIGEARDDELKTYTVVADMRSGGRAKYYYSEKLGSLRLGSMKPTTLPELRALVRNP